MTTSTAAPVSVLLSRRDIPDHFTDTEHLEEFMSRPTQELIDDLVNAPGDIIILGVAGKMGVTLGRLLQRAVPDRRVIGVARFSDTEARDKLESWGVETIACDLLDRAAVDALPKVPNVIYMAGLKFDAAGREDFLWAMNTLAPANVAEAYKDSRIVALSTIHVYPWSNPAQGGVDENTAPRARPGEYANSVVGRERIFQYYSHRHGTPGRNVRFVYAIDTRYGVLQEIADWVWNGVPIPLETGMVNVMWQGDAINHFARLLARTESPTTPINIGGPELVSVRHLATQFGEIFGTEPVFTGTETDCLVVNCEQAALELGNPYIPVRTMVRWVAEWTSAGKPTIGKPSKFQVRTGSF